MQKTQLKLGFSHAQLMTQHNSIMLVASAALGGGKSKPSGSPTSMGPDVKDIGAGHNSPEAAAAAINAALLG